MAEHLVPHAPSPHAPSSQTPSPQTSSPQTLSPQPLSPQPLSPQPLPSDGTAAESADRYHLAQFNVGKMRFPLDDPRMSGFVADLDPINALADAAPGFVWRLVEDGASDATGLRPLGADVIVNFSVWRSTEALWDFVYRTVHLDVMRRRREWFERHREPHLVLWWIPAGHIPTVAEALERLALLRAAGPSPRAFTFSTLHAPEEAAASR